MSENVEHQPWMDSPWVSTLENYEDNGIEDVLELSKIAWFDVKMEFGDTEIEKKEKVEAIQEQIRMGILQPNGFPTGMKVPQGAYVQELNGYNKIVNRQGTLPLKFSNTPVTKNLLEASNKPATILPRMIPGILPTLPIPQTGKDRNIFEKGEESLRRIQELTRDRRK